MASLGAGPYASGDVAKAMQRSTSQVANTRESLIRRGLCFSRRYGEIEFTVPMFDEYLRRTGLQNLLTDKNKVEALELKSAQPFDLLQSGISLNHH